MDMGSKISTALGINEEKQAHAMIPGLPTEMQVQLGATVSSVRKSKGKANELIQKFGRNPPTFLMTELSSIEQRLRELRTQLNEWNFNVKSEWYNRASIYSDKQDHYMFNMMNSAALANNSASDGSEDDEESQDCPDMYSWCHKCHAVRFWCVHMGKIHRSGPKP